MPGEECDGEENEELRWAQRHVKDDPVQDVFRKTELHTEPPHPGNPAPPVRRQRKKKISRLEYRLEFLEHRVGLLEKRGRS